MQPTAAATELQHQYAELSPTGVYYSARRTGDTANGGLLLKRQEKEHPYSVFSQVEGIYEDYDSPYEVPLINLHVLYIYNIRIKFDKK